ncbi:MAG: 30S ribosomal protein S8 [candidate division WOR-3 bacterium]
MMTDPIADMLTRIKNSIMAGHKEVKVPHSKMKEKIAGILKREGFIEDYEVIGEIPKKEILIKFKIYKGKNAITELKRISKPGRRIYVDKDEIPWVMNGLGIAIISTSKGLLTDREARKNKIGGEVICYVW